MPSAHDPPSGLPHRPDAPLASDESAAKIDAGGPVRILIVEDDLLIATQTETLLTEAGFDVMGIVATAEKALEMAAIDPPHLAIVDIRLAGVRDGIDAALELFRRHGIRCIFASAYSDHEARQRAAAAAPLGWLQKPYSMASLTTAVRAAATEVRGKAGR